MKIEDYGNEAYQVEYILSLTCMNWRLALNYFDGKSILIYNKFYTHKLFSNNLPRKVYKLSKQILPRL